MTLLCVIIMKNYISSEITMKKLILTGFEPFGGEKSNPSWDAVERIPSELNGYSITKLRLPVVFGEAADLIIKEAEHILPDVILCIGQAGGRDAITPELVGINLRYARIPDNMGNQPKDEPVIVGGANAYFTKLPMRRIADSINNAGIPARLSYSAGAYVCNDLIYTLLLKFENTETRVGFIHVPYYNEQGKEPSLELEKIIKALVIAIENLD